MRIAVLHHPKSFFPLDVYQRVHDTAELIWVVDSTHWEGDQPGEPGPSGPGGSGDHRWLRRLGPVVDIAGLEPDEAADRVAAHHPDGVVSFCDDTIEMAAGMAARLSLTYHSPQVAAALVDKQRQREALERDGLPSARYWSVPAAIDQATADRAGRAHHLSGGRQARAGQWQP